MWIGFKTLISNLWIDMVISGSNLNEQKYCYVTKFPEYLVIQLFWLQFDERNYKIR